MCTTSRLCRGCLECSTNWLPSSPSIVHRCQKHYVQVNSSLSPLPLSHHRTLTVAKAIYTVHKIINVKISVKLMALKPSTVSSRKQTGKLLVPHTQAHTHTHACTHMHTRMHTHTRIPPPLLPLYCPCLGHHSFHHHLLQFPWTYSNAVLRAGEVSKYSRHSTHPNRNQVSTFKNI